jgi:hypothetical protein
MDFDDIFELLESVRLYRLRAKERLVPIMSVTGSHFGYATADSDFPSVTWTILAHRAKTTAVARGTKEARHIRELLATHMGRKQLLEELRSGTLEYGVSRASVPVEAPPEPAPAPQGPRQVLLPL